MPQRLLDVLCSFASGVPDPATSDVLRHPEVAPVFAADAGFRAIALGDGLWAAVRAGGDGGCRVLAVHNVSHRRSRFTPPEGLRRPEPGLRYLCGEMRTSQNAQGELVCELEPHGYVWLAACDVDTTRLETAPPLC
ncbi:hypothetical protein IF129_23050 [Streptomyces chumphonensis]|uniref:Uncharacterized protein n=1 Tax=Streptomyces chumphonensis TaxID=1214925 RepID=A0A927F2R0_9ACTN|nr:hypothetical protein [Streptomyces chumphonensis]MBD3934428.1 hypothetical protein [Streptomyces chumphonensis]